MGMDLVRISCGRNTSEIQVSILLHAHKQKDYALWSDMLHIKDLYLCGRIMQVRDGTRTHFWGDSWCGHSSLKGGFPDLFEICNEQDIDGWRVVDDDYSQAVGNPKRKV
jgi:hypothetical protein